MDKRYNLYVQCDLNRLEKSLILLKKSEGFLGLVSSSKYLPNHYAQLFPIKDMNDFSYNYAYFDNFQ